MFGLRKPAAEPAPKPREAMAPGDALAIVTKMHALGSTFGQGYDRHTGSPMWVYRAPQEHAAECDRLAESIPYSDFVVAIHQLPRGAIVPGAMMPPPRRA